MKNEHDFPCFGRDLEKFVLYGNQIPVYRSFPKTLDVEVASDFSKNPYDKKARELLNRYDTAEEILQAGKEHFRVCGECSQKIREIKKKYEKMSEEKLEELTDKQKENLRYFGII